MAPRLVALEGVIVAEILKIVANPDAAAPDLRSVAQCLRNLADTIERGECGEVIRGAVVLRSAGRGPIVCGHGDTGPAQVYMDLHAGAQQLMGMTSPERG